MDTISLERALQKIALRHKAKWGIKLQTGVFPSDQIFKHWNLDKTKVSAAIIVNTDPSNLPGQHWQAIWFSPELGEFNPSICYFFDSYGQLPEKSIKEFTEKLSDITIWQNQVIQSPHSTVCGELCCLFLWSMANGFPLKDFLKQFSETNFEDNDRLAKKLFNQIFNPSTLTCFQRCRKFASCF